MDRVPFLRQMVEQKPDDPFPRYALAMELKKQGDQKSAWLEFDELLRSHATYVAAYLMAGNLLAEMGQPDRAREVYESGMKVATAANDDHTRAELEAARAGLD